MQLPDEPFIVVRTNQESAEPRGTIELGADGVGVLEVVAHVQDDLASRRVLDHADELAELVPDFRRTGSRAAVAGQLEIDGGERASLSGGATSRK
jgi:hypothetical protein